MPRPVRPRGATCIGKATWVVPEESCRRVFRRYAVASAQPSARWKLPAVLVAGVLEPPPAREGYAGRAPPLSLSVVTRAGHGRHRPQGAGGRGNLGHLWHSRQPPLSPMLMLTEAGHRWTVNGVDRPPQWSRCPCRCAGEHRGALSDWRM